VRKARIVQGLLYLRGPASDGWRVAVCSLLPVAWPRHGIPWPEGPSIMIGASLAKNADALQTSRLPPGACGGDRSGAALPPFPSPPWCLVYMPRDCSKRADILIMRRHLCHLRHCGNGAAAAVPGSGPSGEDWVGIPYPSLSMSPLLDLPFLLALGGLPIPGMLTRWILRAPRVSSGALPPVSCCSAGLPDRLAGPLLPASSTTSTNSL